MSRKVRVTTGITGPYIWIAVSTCDVSLNRILSFGLFILCFTRFIQIRQVCRCIAQQRRRGCREAPSWPIATAANSRSLKRWRLIAMYRLESRSGVCHTATRYSSRKRNILSCALRDRSRDVSWICGRSNRLQQPGYSTHYRCGRRCAGHVPVTAASLRGQNVYPGRRDRSWPSLIVGYDAGWWPWRDPRFRPAGLRKS